MDGDSELEVIGNVATGDVTATDGDGSPAVDYDPAPGGGEHVDKSKVLNLFENPIVADLDGAPGVEVLKGGFTLDRLVNVGVAVGQNLPYNHVLQSWNGQTGASLPSYPQAVEDYQLLSSPAVADLSPLPGNEAVVGTGLYLIRNVNATGVEAPAWPKFTGGWNFAVPAVGDVDNDGDLEVSAAPARASRSSGKPTARRAPTTRSLGPRTTTSGRQATMAPTRDLPERRGPRRAAQPLDRHAQLLAARRRLDVRHRRAKVIASPNPIQHPGDGTHPRG